MEKAAEDAKASASAAVGPFAYIEINVILAPATAIFLWLPPFSSYSIETEHMPPKTLNELLTGVLASDCEISLSKSHIALLLFIHHRLYSFSDQQQDLSESELQSLFQSVDRLESQEPAGLAARGRAAIDSLKRSKIIVRSDCGGLSAAKPLYCLTSLGRAIAETIARDLDYDRETLRAILSEATVRLVELQQNCKCLTSADDLQSVIAIPMREFIHGAFERILRYQATLDVEHEAFREHIFRLVQTKAEQAIEPCIELLDQSKKTITDLRDILLGSIGTIDDIVLDIGMKAGHPSAKAAAQGLLKRTAQIADWTRTRMEAWSLHYQNATSFLRDVLRVDPKREIAERLKAAIKTYPEDSLKLEVCRESGLRQFNAAFLDFPPPRPRRPKEDFVVEDVDAAPADAKKLAGEIIQKFEERIRSQKRAGLAEVLREVDQATWADLHQATGIVMQRLLRTFESIAEHDFQWTKVREQAEIQDIICEDK